MTYEKLSPADITQLLDLMRQYKRSVGEPPLNPEQKEALQQAILNGQITYYICKNRDNIVAMCSVVIAFSSYTCEPMGIFEDFFISLGFRGRGIARGLTGFVFEEMKSQNIASLWIGCAEQDMDMYKSLGFKTRLGNLLTWSNTP